MATTPDKVITSCAVTGSVHTPAQWEQYKLEHAKAGFATELASAD